MDIRDRMYISVSKPNLFLEATKTIKRDNNDQLLDTTD